MPVNDKDIIALDIMASGRATNEQMVDLMAETGLNQDDITAWKLSKTQPAEIADDLKVKVLDKVRTKKEGKNNEQLLATVSGAKQGLTFGFSDEIEAGIKAGYARLFEGADFEKKYEQEVKKERDILKKYEEKYPINFIGAEIASSALIPVPGTLGVKGVIKAAQYMKKFGGLALDALISSAGKSEAEFMTKDFIQDVSKGTAFGVGGGLILGKGAKKAAELVKKGEKPAEKAAQVVSSILFDLPPKYTERLIDPKTAQKILNPKSAQDIVTSITDLTTEMSQHAKALSEKAKQSLSRKKDISFDDEIAPLIREMKTYKTSMIGKMDKAVSAKNAGFKAMEDLISRGTKDARLSEKDLKSFIQAVDDEIPFDKLSWEPKEELLGDIRGTIDGFLKNRNQAYRDNMIPVAKLMDNLTDISKAFSLRRKGYRIEPSDTTFSKTKTFYDAFGESKRPVTAEAFEEARKFFPDKNILEDIELSQIARRSEGGMPAGAKNIALGAYVGYLFNTPWFGVVAGGVKDRYGRKVGKSLIPALSGAINWTDEAARKSLEKLSPEAIEAIEAAARESGRVIGVRSSVENRSSILPNQQQSILPRR